MISAMKQKLLTLPPLPQVNRRLMQAIVRCRVKDRVQSSVSAKLLDECPDRADPKTGEREKGHCAHRCRRVGRKRRADVPRCTDRLVCEVQSRRTGYTARLPAQSSPWLG